MLLNKNLIQLQEVYVLSFLYNTIAKIIPCNIQRVQIPALKIDEIKKYKFPVIWKFSTWNISI